MKIQPEKKSPLSREALASPKADLRQLRTNTHATVAELKAFLREMKGKSPPEMLGIVAASQLIRSLALASLVVALAIVVFTVVPYFLADGSGGPATAAEASSPPPASPSPGPAVEPSPTSGPDPIETLGVGEERGAPANVNPLEDQRDNFLEGLD